MRKLALLVLLSSCAHPESKPAEPLEKPVAKPTTPAPTSCPGTRMVGWRAESELTPLDYSTYEAAVKRCPELYPSAPCLRVLFKAPDGAYKAICGPAKDETPPPPAAEPV